MKHKFSGLKCVLILCTLRPPKHKTQKSGKSIYTLVVYLLKINRTTTPRFTSGQAHAVSFWLLKVVSAILTNGCSTNRSSRLSNPFSIIDYSTFTPRFSECYFLGKRELQLTYSHTLRIITTYSNANATSVFAHPRNPPPTHLRFASPAHFHSVQFIGQLFSCFK